MGMASSQARFLSLTSRMHQIEYKAAKLEAQKLQMANESTRVYNEYLDALEQTKIQHSQLERDGSVGYRDVSINDLYFGGAGKQYGLFSTQNGFMYVPQAIKDAYETSATAHEFAVSLSNYTPPVAPAQEAEPVAENTDITMHMGDVTTTTITNSPITLTLKDTFKGGDYTYTISSASNETANFKYLENGRLVIEGNNLIIEQQNGGQNDDLIIIGGGNHISTGDGNDTVRVGTAVDSLNTWTVQSDNNYVDTGAGNDYIQIFGIHNEVHSGTGNDALYDNSANTTINADNATKTYSANGTLEWIRQQQYGDCQTLSLINSINNRGQFSQYFNVTQSGENYTVKFIKSNSTVTVTPEDITSRSSKGDDDIAVIEAGFRKLIEAEGYNINGEADDMSVGTSTNFHITAKYILGADAASCVLNTEDIFNDLYALYTNGTISNLVVGTVQDESQDNKQLGICYQHAYSVINATSNTVTVANPHDTKDSITLSRENFFRYFKSAIVFGETISGLSVLIDAYNEGNSRNIEEAPTNIYSDTYAISAQQRYDYYINMYNAIKTAGGCEVLDNKALCSNTYLTNIINGGYAYLKEFDDIQANWFDTSVATNTSLREVPDEINLKKAEAKYEADMRKIDMKDRKYDMDLAALDTERNAIKQEMETLKTVIKENVERTFKLFS